MKHRHHIRLALGCGVATLALLVAHGANAQESEDAQLPTIVVDEAAPGGEGPGGIAPVRGVVAEQTRTGAKSATTIREIPQSVSVIGREEIDNQGAQKVDEALRYTPGVFTQPFGPDSDTNWMFIRGFQATASGTYLDGLPYYSHGFGGFFVDSFGLERIETLRGASSVLYGGGNPGGLLNYVSKRPDFSRKRYVETGVNEAGNVHLGFDFADVASEAVAWRLNGRLAGGKSFSDFQKGWRGVISPSLTFKPDAATSLTLLANYTHIDENHNGGSFLPYAGTVVDRIVGGVNYGRISRSANFTEPSVDRYDRRQGSFGYELEHSFDNDWTVRSQARFGIAKVDEVSVYPNGWATARTLDRINFDHDTTAKTFLIDNQIEGKFETGAVEHTLLAGIDYKYYNIDHVQSSGLWGATPPIDAFNPVYGAALGQRVSYLNQDLTQQQLGIYLQNQIRFGDGWLVTLNGRYDRGWLKAHDRETFYSPGLNTVQRATHGKLSGRAGIAYSFDSGITPYASVATFFNPIIGTNANGALFRPEEGIQYEAGVKYSPSFIDGLFTLSVFELTRRNVPSNVTLFTQMQTGEIRSRGIELEAKVNVTPNLALTGALTAYDIDITKDEDPTLVGKTPFIVPQFLAAASADYTFSGGDWYDGITIGGGFRYQGASWADNQNTLRVPGAGLVDLKIGYKKQNWGVDLNVTNLFDKKYVSSCQTAVTCSYGEGRSFKLKAHASW